MATGCKDAPKPDGAGGMEPRLDHNSLHEIERVKKKAFVIEADVSQTRGNVAVAEGHFLNAVEVRAGLGRHENTVSPFAIKRKPRPSRG